MFSKLLMVKLAGVATAAVVASAGMAAASPGSTAAAQLAHAKQSITKYQSTAVARQAGYGLLKDAKGIACITDPMGGMGVHLVNGSLVGDATVKTHVARIFSKLDLHDRAQAVVLAYETGLVHPGATEPLSS